MSAGIGMSVFGLFGGMTGGELSRIVYCGRFLSLVGRGVLLLFIVYYSM